MKKKYCIKAYDPIATNNFKKVLEHQNLSFSDNLYGVLDKVDALLLLTEWNEFRSPDFNKMRKLMKNAVIFDGKNIYSNKNILKKGFKHFQVGVKS